jgi:hypothetical protein
MHITSNWLSTGSQRFSSIAGAINTQPGQRPLTINRLCAVTGDWCGCLFAELEANYKSLRAQACDRPPDTARGDDPRLSNV